MPAVAPLSTYVSATGQKVKDGGTKVPFLLTATVKKLLVPAWVTEGRQVIMPLLVFKLAPLGAFSKDHIRGSGGEFGSLAFTVNERVTPALRTWFVTGGTTGASGGGETGLAATSVELLLCPPLLLAVMT